MATTGMYGAPVIGAGPVWYNTQAYGQNKSRPYNAQVEDISAAFNGMQVYGNTPGQPFSRINTGYQGFPAAMLPGHNVWANRFFMPSHGMMPQGFSSIPSGHAINGIQQNGDVPELARRQSLSSNEEFGPRTPFYAAAPHGPAAAVKGVIGDTSPQSLYTPPQVPANSPQQLWREGKGYIVTDFDAICTTAPPIPQPIPAIFSGDKSRGTLETSLENKNKTTNVYIRGLHPDTTDEMLNAYGSRFGLIESAKSMIDQHTGLCKGFGFIKYQNYGDGENCIRGFYHWGYEAKWARDSHNDKLKKLGDEHNTNLYISNIPTDLDFNEASLMQIFGKYQCMSAKILRDSNGLSRGVSFARFENPDVCRQIINEFNGQPVGELGQPIAIRFADTPDQKRLKAVTQERRQYKTHEYNVAAFGPDSPYSHYGAMVAASSPSMQNRSPLGGVYGNNTPYHPSIGITMPGSAGADATPLAGRVGGPRFTPHSVMINNAKPELVDIKTEKTDGEAVLTGRSTNVPAKVPNDTAKTPRRGENIQKHGSATTSPVKASQTKFTPVKIAKVALPKVAGTA